MNRNSCTNKQWNCWGFYLKFQVPSIFRDIWRMMLDTDTNMSLEYLGIYEYLGLGFSFSLKSWSDTLLYFFNLIYVSEPDDLKAKNRGSKNKQGRGSQLHLHPRLPGLIWFRLHRFRLEAGTWIAVKCTRPPTVNVLLCNNVMWMWFQGVGNDAFAWASGSCNLGVMNRAADWRHLRRMGSGCTAADECGRRREHAVMCNQSSSFLFQHISVCGAQRDLFEIINW